MTNPKYLAQLHRNISHSFDEEELRTLCFSLAVDYDNLPGRGKAAKARDLVALMVRTNRLPELVNRCRDERPQVRWEFKVRLFLGYKRKAETDTRLAEYLHQYLTGRGHEVFIDRSMRMGTDWLDEIDRQIKAADFLIALLSRESADSEMLKAEILRAYEYRKQHGHPQILPVRVNYRDMLPYAVAAFINPQQYVVWEDETHNERVAEDILTAIDGKLPLREAIEPVLNEAEPVVLIDGRMVEKDTLCSPLPEVDPRFLETLVAPGGAVRLSDELYIERAYDAQIRWQVKGRGTITTIRAPRQTGKSSLLIRGMQYAREQGANVVHLDLQAVDEDYLATLDVFLRYLARTLIHKLRLEPGLEDNIWRRPLGAKDKLNRLMEEHILPAPRGQLVLAIDEADLLLNTNFHNEFFALMRAWYNSAAYEELWQRLNIMMVISTEPYLLIQDLRQSPFNVGLKLYLEDFDEDQVRELNRRHRNPVKDNDFPELMRLLRGHPYLTRRALYVLLTEAMSWSALNSLASSDQGPFADHLRRHLWLLQGRPDLQAALEEVVQNGRHHNEDALFRLTQAGIIKGSGHSYACRCELYQRYFENRL